MNREELIQQVVAQVQRQQSERKPNALLIGHAPNVNLGWNYVSEPPYEAVVIGSLSAGELLRFPDNSCADALLSGLPVLLWEEGLEYRRYAHTTNRVLWSRLLSAERQLKQLGVRFLGAPGTRLLTAEEVRRRLRDGLPVQGRLTPLAKDILEGKA
ncbi:MAG: hypothetical protein ACI3VY_02455 [Faecousia sp.]